MVKCAECGFLASRNCKTRLLEETEQYTRDTGFPPSDMLNKEHQTICEPPICFKRKYDLWAEQGRKLAIICFDDGDKLLSAVQKERDCNLFTKWIQGLTPREHQEMMDRDRRDKFEEEIRRNDRKWHWIELAAIIVGTGLFTLLGAFIARMN